GDNIPRERAIATEQPSFDRESAKLASIKERRGRYRASPSHHLVDPGQAPAGAGSPKGPLRLRVLGIDDPAAGMMDGLIVVPSSRVISPLSSSVLISSPESVSSSSIALAS